VTQKDIANALGVSLITVHRALNDSGYVSRELRERVLAYAKKVGYVPHRASQTLARNKVRRLAVFSSSLPAYFWNEIGRGIGIGAEQIQPFNYRVSYHRIEDGNTPAYLRRLRQEIRDGLEAVALVNQWIFDMGAAIDMVEKSGIPYLTLNVDAPYSRRLCYVGPDYRAGGRLAAEYIGKTLLFKRRPRVLVISARAEVPEESHAPDINELRYEGFRDLLERRFPGVLHEVRHLSGGMRSTEIARQLRGLLRDAHGKVDAIYLIAAHNAHFIRALEEDAHWDVVVLLHDLDATASHYLERNLLTAVIYQNPILQGYYAVKILENLLESGHPPEVRELTIVHNLVLNENRDLYRNHYLFAKMID
jgi:LacI family transcriptional regulator